MKPLASILLTAFTASAAGRADIGAAKRVAAVIIAEAGGESERGMRAVAEVIRNRANIAGSSSIREVMRPGAFECLQGRNTALLYAATKWHENFTLALSMAVAIQDRPGTFGDLTHGATHFERTNAPRPKWARGKRPVAVIGKHSFYRLRFP